MHGEAAQQLANTTFTHRQVFLKNTIKVFFNFLRGFLVFSNVSFASIQSQEVAREKKNFLSSLWSLAEAVVLWGCALTIAHKSCAQIASHILFWLKKKLKIGQPGNDSCTNLESNTLLFLVKIVKHSFCSCNFTFVFRNSHALELYRLLHSNNLAL